MIDWTLHSASNESTRVLYSEFPQGRLHYVSPSQSDKAPLCLIFPGFTGDAWSHQDFISLACKYGIACLCITPQWEPSTEAIIENITVLASNMKGDQHILNRFHYIRGVSYGAFLSLVWLSYLDAPIKKISWITPCSNRQIKDAAKLMGTPLQATDNYPIKIKNISPEVKILTINNDQIIPNLDPMFTEVFVNTSLHQIRYDDHFSAGDTTSATTEVVQWLGGTA